MKNRKALQLCGEVGRTLSQVLAWESGDDLLRDVVVDSVTPAPDSSRLLVIVYSPKGIGELGLVAFLEGSPGRAARSRPWTAGSSRALVWLSPSNSRPTGRACPGNIRHWPAPNLPPEARVEWR